MPIRLFAVTVTGKDTGARQRAMRQIHREFHTVPAVQVWSVAADGVDVGGFRPAGSRCDDVRALLRLRPEQT